MKYRELIVVLCVVALVCIWWGRDTESRIEPAPTRSPSVAAKSEAEAPVETSLKEVPPVIEKPRIEMPKVPTLELTRIDKGKWTKDLLVKAKLKADVEASIPLSEDGKPYTHLRMDLGGVLWNWEPKSPRTEKTRVLKSGEQMEWTFGLDSFSLIEDETEFLKAAKKHPVIIEATITEAGSIKPSPFMRSPFVFMTGDLTVPVLESDT